MKLKVLESMKPKVASFGFSKESIESFANQIAEDLKDDATDEEIDARIDAVIPFFKISQSEITRVVNHKKSKTVDVPPKENQPKEPEEPKEPTDKLDKLFKLIEAQNQAIANLTNKEVTKTRKAIYEEKLKPLPAALQKSLLKKFERISFKDNEDFDEFLAEEEKDIPEIAKAHSESKLDEMGKPIRGGFTKKEATDAEVDDIINNLNI